MQQGEDAITSGKVFPDEIGQGEGIGTIYTALVVGGCIPWLGADRADEPTAATRVADSQGCADPRKKAMICRAVSEKAPRTAHKFSSMVVVLLKMAPSLVCQNDLDGTLATKKVADCAVRAHMGHASADRMQKIWESGRQARNAVWEWTVAIKHVCLCVYESRK